jgi:hypothetical protein
MEKNDNAVEFRNLVNAILKKSPNNINLVSRKLTVSIPTVRRWAKGDSCPHYLVRPNMIVELKNILLEP